MMPIGLWAYSIAADRCLE